MKNDALSFCRWSHGLQSVVFGQAVPLCLIHNENNKNIMITARSRPWDKGGGGGLQKTFFGPQFGPQNGAKPGGHRAVTMILSCGESENVGREFNS